MSHSSLNSHPILQQKIGRPLFWDEVCHHLNFNPADNRPENLMAISASEHMSLHRHLEALKRRGLCIPLTEEGQSGLLTGAKPKMGTITITIKRPDDATPERALELLKKGVKPSEMARMWGIHRTYIYYLLHKAGWKAPNPTP